MTTDAEVQTVIYIPIRKPAEPKTEKTEEEEVKVGSGQGEEVPYGRTMQAHPGRIYTADRF